jgi:GGDEF domain-containing protein
MAMIVTILLALECELFSFVAELSEPQGKISLAEAIFLTALLALCIVAFVIRRSREERRDVVRQATDKIRLQEFKREASQDSLRSLANRRSILDALMQRLLRHLPLLPFP